MNEGFWNKEDNYEGYSPEHDDAEAHAEAEQEAEPVEVVEEYTAPTEPVEWPKNLGKYGRLGVRGSDPRVYDKGEGVGIILDRLGWDGDTFTTELAEEVKQIQEENGLLATGRVDQKTWQIIVNG